MIAHMNQTKQCSFVLIPSWLQSLALNILEFLTIVKTKLLGTHFFCVLITRNYPCVDSHSLASGVHPFGTMTNKGLP